MGCTKNAKNYSSTSRVSNNAKGQHDEGAAVPAATCTPGNAEALDVIGDDKQEPRDGPPEGKQSTTTPGATKAREEEVQVDKELEEVHKQVEGPEEAPW